MPIKRALLSVSDKAGIAAFAQRLTATGVEIISTGGTAATLRAEGIEVIDVGDLTQFPEMLDGRVKTLHPAIHGGLLAKRGDPAHAQQLAALDIRPIDLLVVNLYPFVETVRRPGATDDEIIEQIDIGGPAMTRGAAKNFAGVSVVVHPSDYEMVIQEIERSGGLTLETRRSLAAAAFRHTAAYDAAVAAYFNGGVSGTPVELASTRSLLNRPRQTLRYGENPHQEAVYLAPAEPAIDVLHGKELSYNNLLDVDAAIQLIAEFAEAPPTVAIIKHTNPCGVGTADTLEEAYARAFATDRQSPFGGIVVVNRPLDQTTAEAIDAIFTEVIIAPTFEDGVLEFLQQKTNRRLVAARPRDATSSVSVRSASGGLLVQESDAPLASLSEMRQSWNVVTDIQLTEAQWDDLDFAWRVAKHVKSNAMVYARDGATLGIGAGQMSRIDASEVAVAKGGKSDLDFSDSVVASDAFFPFADGLEAAAAAGAVAVIQPGGSVRDDEVIAAANRLGIAMVFTGRRHFRH